MPRGWIPRPLGRKEQARSCPIACCGVFDFGIRQNALYNVKKVKEAITMRAELKEYQAVEAAAMKFVKSVAEGNSAYAKELFTDEAASAEDGWRMEMRCKGI